MNQSNVIQNAVLFVHGLTNSMGDKQWRDRLCLRDHLAQLGLASYEFDYRGRGSDRAHQSDFSLATATEDLDCVLRHIYSEYRHAKIILIGKGMAAFICLSSQEVRSRNLPMVLWQPIFYPLRTMEIRGHVGAFNQAYLLSNGHQYVEVEGVRLGSSFFAQLSDASPALVWPGAEMHALYTSGDGVSPREWIEEFLDAAKSEKNAKVTTRLLDVPDASGENHSSKTIEHLHESRPDRFIRETLDVIRREILLMP